MKRPAIIIVFLAIILAAYQPAFAIDTDNDGLDDSVETNTGIYNGPLDTGTNPANPDTDGDGVLDGVEVEYGSNPLDPIIKPFAWKIGSDSRVTDGNAYAYYPDLVWASTNYGIAWEDDRTSGGVYFTRFNATGTKLSADILETSTAGGAGLMWNGSQYLIGWAVVATHYGMPTGLVVYSQRMDALGTKIGSPLRVAGNWDAMGFPIGYTWNGTQYAVTYWVYPTGFPSFPFTMYFSRINSSGALIGSPTSIGPIYLTSNPLFGTGDPLTPGSLVWNGSEYGMAWYDHSPPPSGNLEIFFARISSTGSKIGSNVQITNSSGNSIFPSMVWNGTEYGLFWVDNRDGNYEIYFTRISSTGTKIGPDIRITNANYDSTSPIVKWNGSEYGLTWTDNRNGNSPRVYFCRLDSSGRKIGGEIQITTVSSSGPYICWNSTEYGIVWTNGPIYLSRIAIDEDGDGLDTATEILLGTSNNNWDTDGDGLSDGYEYAHGLDPLSPDTDDDTMPDGWEIINVLNPLSNDSSSDADNDQLTNLQEYQAGTNPHSPDSDGDIMPDGWEVANGFNPIINDSANDPDNDQLSNLGEYLAGTNPHNADTDGDTMPDGWEIINVLNPLSNDSSADPDNDQLTNLQEYQAGTNPHSSDTDGDTMPDGWEISNNFNPLVNDSAGDPDNDMLTNLQEYLAGTDPHSADTDGDGMPDGWELAHGLNPLIPESSADSDNDGLADLAEFQAGTNPHSPDTDGDSMPDGWEVSNGLNPLADDMLADPDGDGLCNLYEYHANTNPNVTDTDSDTMPDGWEVTYSLDPLINDAGDDPDNDGLSNLDEFSAGTNPGMWDTDGDSWSDGQEITQGTDPLDPGSHPVTAPLVQAVDSAATGGGGCTIPRRSQADPIMPMLLLLIAAARLLKKPRINR